jgi:hypothetical protein
MRITAKATYRLVLILSSFNREKDMKQPTWDNRLQFLGKLPGVKQPVTACIVKKAEETAGRKSGTKTFGNHLEFSSLKTIRDKVGEREWLKQQ